MFSKFELIGMGASVFFMALAIYLVQVESTFFGSKPVGQSAQLISSVNNEAVVVGYSEFPNRARKDAYLEAVDFNGNFNRMVIDDIKIGTGDSVKQGDTVAVHYVGTLQGESEEFDNSRKRGEPLEFTVGNGMVIQGWDEGLVGMKEGGQRVLVIPPKMAYGERGIGPIPPNSTLVFSIELMEIK